MNGNWNQQTSPEQNYLFGGKELNKDYDLNIIDFINRNQDPATGRFLQVDKLAAHPNQIDKSPYAYAWNNPVNLTDPDGNCPKCLKALFKTAVKSIAKGKLDLGEVYDIADNAVTLFSPSSTLVERGEAAFNLASPVSTKELKGAKNLITGSNARSVVSRNKPSPGLNEKEFANEIENLMSPHSKKGASSVTINTSEDLKSGVVKPMDGIVDLHAHGNPDGSVQVVKNGVKRTVSKETAGRFARRYFKDANGFRCLSCYGSETAKAVNKATGKPAIGANTVISESQTGLSLPSGGKIKKFE